MSQQDDTESRERAARTPNDRARMWLAAIVESSDDAIISKSLDGTIESWNSGAERIYGYTEAEAVGQSIRILIPPELWDEEFHILSRIRAGERLSHFETRRVRKDGNTIDVSLTISPIKDTYGTIVGVSKIAREITAERKNERLLRERDENLQWILDLTFQTPWTADPKGTILHFGDQRRRFRPVVDVGTISEEWLNYVHPEDLPATKLAWQRALQRGDGLDVEHRLLLSSGEYCWMQTRAYPRRDAEGHIVKWYGTIADINKLKIAQRVLARQGRLLDLTYEPILVRDQQDRITFWNRGAERVYGWTANDAIGHVSHELLQTEFSEHFESIKWSLAVHGYWTGELVHLTALGVPVNVLSSWVRESTSEGVYILETDFDISEQKRSIAREEQNRAEARADRRYRELLEAAPDGIFEIATDGKIVVVSRSAEAMFGYGRNELIGHSVEILVPEASRAQHIKRRHEYSVSPSTRPMGAGLELLGRRRDGTLFPVEISLSPVHTSDDLFHVIAVVRDVTDRKEYEKQLLAMRDQYTEELASAYRSAEERSRQLEPAGRLKNEFLASMSHELRTPLHTIIGFSELLKERSGGELTETQDRYLGFIHQDAEHLLELINAVLDLSKIEAGRLELRTVPLSLHSCVEEGIGAVSHRAAVKSIRIEDHTEGCEVVVDADPVRIKEILYNLLG